MAHNENLSMRFRETMVSSQTQQGSAPWALTIAPVWVLRRSVHSGNSKPPRTPSPLLPL